jgi:ribosome-binding ATPase YchF (GTP1/OBG family)
MVYVFISEYSETLKAREKLVQKEILDFVKSHIKEEQIPYKIIKSKYHLTDSVLKDIDFKKDILLWEPKIANHNLEIVKRFEKSIVILERPTIYLQKISEHNPINENMAINHGFLIMYLKPEIIDITNEEWKLVINESMYLITIEKLKQLIS